MIRLPRGFTLLEVLIAVAVLGMLLLLLNQGTAFGLKAASLQAVRDERQGDLVAVDRAIRGMIAHADPGVAPNPASIKGGPTRIAMVTEIPSPAGGEPERVDAVLLTQDDRLLLRWSPRRHVTPIGPTPQPQQTVLLTGVRGVEFAYFGEEGWRPDWTSAKLPALVRLTLAFTDASRHWPPIVVAPLEESVEQ